MSKAEERALEQYPVEMYENVGWRCVDKNTYKRQYFIEGYNQAEKDLELTWRNMEEIVEIANLLETEWLNSTPWDGIRDWGFYKEILKRFKERKEK